MREMLPVRVRITELIKKADDLMYTVKIGEKGHYAFF